MTRQSIRRRITVFGAAGGLAIMMLSGAPAALAADQTVDISGFAFAPQALTVSVGDTVTWTNADAQGHTATADDASFDTGTIGGSASKSVTLTTAGTYAYHCKIHPAMTGTLTVQAAAATPGATVPPTDTIAATPTTGSSGPGAWAAITLVLAAIVGLGLGWRRFRQDAAGR